LNNVINKRGDAFDLTGEFPVKRAQMWQTAQNNNRSANPEAVANKRNSVDDKR
jgi:hypothetical protein